jgi:hypothetical protein
MVGQVTYLLDMWYSLCSDNRDTMSLNSAGVTQSKIFGCGLDYWWNVDENLARLTEV